MTRSPGLSALTRRRFATPRSAALVIVALIAFAAFVIAAAPRALVGVVRAEVAHQIADMPAVARDLSASLLGMPVVGAATDPEVSAGWDEGAAEVFGAFGQLLAENRDSLDPALEPLVSDARFALYGQPTLVVPQALPADAPLSLVQLLADPEQQQHLELVDGEWPAAWSGDGTLEIVLSAEAAATMQWPVGEQRALPGDPSAPTTSGRSADGPVMELVGTVEASDPEADRWTHLPTALTATVFDDGNRRPRATSVAWVHPESRANLDHFDDPAMTLWYPVDGRAAIGQEPVALLSALRAATSSSVPVDDAGQLRVRFQSEIVDVLSTALARANSASAILAVAAVGPLAVSVALVVLAAALMIRRRRADLSLMSARGAPLARLRRLLLGEGLILGLPIAVTAATVAVVVTPNDAGPAPTIAAIAVGVVPGLALAFTLRPALLERGRSDLDAPQRSKAVRIAEAVVLLLALVAVVQLFVRGIGPATDGIDPLVVAAPLLATVAVALIVVRLHPLPIAAALRVARRGRGVVGLVGAARNLRDSAAGTTAVLAMLVAVAIAVFSSLVLATVDRGAVVAAQRDVGGDIRLAGPYFDADTIDRMRAVDGVVEAVGMLRGDYVSVTGPGGRESVQVTVTEVERLAAVQAGMVGALPPGLIRPGSDPVQLVESTALVESLGEGDASAAEQPVDVVGTLERVLGLSGSEKFVLMDQADYASLTGFGFFPRTVMIEIADDADPAAVVAELDDIVGGAHSVRVLEESTAEIQASPAVSALRFVLFAALGIAVALSVVALLLVAGVSQDARSRVIALLRSMGLDRRRARGVVAWEFAPLGVTALVGGVVLGAVLPLLVVTSIDLRPFTGGGGQPAVAVDPVLSGALIAVVVVALALAVVGGVVSARTTSMATVLRTEED
ncbi:FtsX-like permease family protein [Microbacterium sp. CFBP9034]|uniref:ABC transporter permease n=1 Tax=Microbacterium sp. CFBP9034 TaxID=3096540 RepID=UPI002A6A49A4|nr:FtsX-like permease family protein [Microbacterium sp. CFBP9034]MDY0910974.1 FtsX-like permease family protein [Microbacterium sp. CFBP9034]